MKKPKTSPYISVITVDEDPQKSQTLPIYPMNYPPGMTPNPETIKEWYRGALVEAAFPARIPKDQLDIFVAQLVEVSKGLLQDVQAHHANQSYSFNHRLNSYILVQPITTLSPKNQKTIAKIFALEDELNAIMKTYQEKRQKLNESLIFPFGTLDYLPSERKFVSVLIPKDQGDRLKQENDRQIAAIHERHARNAKPVYDALQVAAQDALQKVWKKMSAKLQSVLLKHKMPIGPERQLTSGSEP